MTSFRGCIPDFQLANPLYVGAIVSFFTVDASGNATATLATLFAAPTGATTVNNPQTLDGDGKFAAPVYIDAPVIAQVTSATLGSHSTGVINARGTWRGDWAGPGTVYFATDFVQDPPTGSIYAVVDDFTSSSAITTDISAGNLVLIFNPNALVAEGANLAIKVAVNLATTTNIALSGLLTVDGVVTTVGMRVLVKNQTVASQNGIYVAQSGAWALASDFNTSNQLAAGTQVLVLNGVVNAHSIWELGTAAPIVLGTTALTFTCVAPYFISGRPWADVIAWGADPTGNTDSSAAFQNAINFMKLVGIGGGIVFVPPGQYLAPGVTLSGSVSLIGAGMGASQLFAWHTDVTVLTCASDWSKAVLSGLTIFAKGTNNDTGTFGASTTTSGLKLQSNAGVDCAIRDVAVLGGYYPINNASVDCAFENVIGSAGYGPAVVNNIGDSWWTRGKLDQNPPVTITSSLPYAAWSAGATVTAGQALVSQGYVLVYTVGGTTGALAPTLKNYGINIADGTATAQISGPSVYSAMQIVGAAGENALYQVDMSGGGCFSNSLVVNAAGAEVELRNIIATNVQLTAATFVNFCGGHWSGTVSVAAGVASLQIEDTFSIGPLTINVANGTGKFKIEGNDFSGGTLTIGTGCTNYFYGGNINCTVVDGSNASNFVAQSATLFNKAALVNNGSLFFQSSSNVNDASIFESTSNNLVIKAGASNAIVLVDNGLTTKLDYGFTTSGRWSFLANVQPDVDNTRTLGGTSGPNRWASVATIIATFGGSSSGNTTVQASATASGTLTLPAATDTLIGKATTDTLTNKTLDTVGTGNAFKINGTQLSTLGATLTISGGGLQTTAGTGEVTWAANSFVTTVAKIGGVTVAGATGTGNSVFSAGATLTGTTTMTTALVANDSTNAGVNGYFCKASGGALDGGFFQGSSNQVLFKMGSANIFGVSPNNLSAFVGDYGSTNASKWTFSADIVATGQIYGPNIATTASAANAFIDTGTTPVGQLKRSTSSLIYKRDVEPLDKATALKVLNDAKPIFYRSTCAGDNPEWSWYGMGAETEAKNDPRLVHWSYQADDYEDVEVQRPHPITGQAVTAIERRLKAGAALKPDAVQYERYVPHLITGWKDHDGRIAALEAQVAQLTAH